MAKKEGIRKLFDNIAPDYDRLNHILSLNIDKGWRKKAVREIANEDKPMKVLDVACGTADFTIEIAQKVSPGSEVTGVDISEGMMAIGREKISKAGVSAELSVADCEALPYPDGTFDRISVGFGVRNFEHLEVGLSEMFRVLVPGGKLVILELSVPSNAFISWCYKLYFLKLLPAIGGLISGNRSAYEYLPASVLRFPAPDRFIGIMKSAGFAVVEHTPMTFGIVPVVLTWYLQTSSWDSVSLVVGASLSIGLLSANVLVVNNYRDMEDDAAVGKRTTVVIFGRKVISIAYLLSGFIGMLVMIPVWLVLPVWALVIPLIYLALHIKTWSDLKQSAGSAINPLLGRTAMNLLIFALFFSGTCLLN